METAHVLILCQFLLSSSHQSLGLLSNFKTCGDRECESTMSRVQALRDHEAQDCRFLNFKKGDMIFVYSKLSGRRNDLWAGSIDRQFGYFPKDAVVVDEIFVDERKEIEVPTQRFDFACFDEYGSLIESDSSESDESSVTEAYLDTSSDDNLISVQGSEDIPTDRSGHTVTQEPSDINNPENAEQSGSTWIGSAVTGWFDTSDPSSNDPKDVIGDQDSLKTRKLALDLEDNQLEKQTKTETFGWIGDELTQVFSFGQKEAEITTEDVADDLLQTKMDDKPEEKDEMSGLSSSWLVMGIRDVLNYGMGDTTKDTEKDEETKSPRDDQTIPESSQSLDTAQKIPGITNEYKKVPSETEEEHSVHSVRPGGDAFSGQPDHLASADTVIKDKAGREAEESGWYGSVYNTFAGMYGEQTNNNAIDDEGLQESDSPEPPPVEVDTEGHKSETGSQSIFSVFEILPWPLKSDTPLGEGIKSNEDKVPEQADSGKDPLIGHQTRISYHLEEENNEVKGNNGNQGEKATADSENICNHTISDLKLAVTETTQTHQNDPLTKSLGPATDTEEITDSHVREDTSTDRLKWQLQDTEKTDIEEEDSQSETERKQNFDSSAEKNEGSGGSYDSSSTDTDTKSVAGITDSVGANALETQSSISQRGSEILYEKSQEQNELGSYNMYSEPVKSAPATTPSPSSDGATSAHNRNNVESIVTRKVSDLGEVQNPDLSLDDSKGLNGTTIPTDIPKGDGVTSSILTNERENNVNGNLDTSEVPSKQEPVAISIKLPDAQETALNPDGNITGSTTVPLVTDETKNGIYSHSSETDERVCKDDSKCGHMNIPIDQNIQPDYESLSEQHSALHTAGTNIINSDLETTSNEKENSIDSHDVFSMTNDDASLKTTIESGKTREGKIALKDEQEKEGKVQRQQEDTGRFDTDMLEDTHSCESSEGYAIKEHQRAPEHVGSETVTKSAQGQPEIHSVEETLKENMLRDFAPDNADSHIYVSGDMEDGIKDSSDQDVQTNRIHSSIALGDFDNSVAEDKVKVPLHDERDVSSYDQNTKLFKRYLEKVYTDGKSQIAYPTEMDLKTEDVGELGVQLVTINESYKQEDSENTPHVIDPISTGESQKSTAHNEKYKNVQIHIGEDIIEDLVNLFGEDKLLWLDNSLRSFGSSTIETFHGDDLAILNGFEQLLKYHMETTGENGVQTDGNVRDEVNATKLAALQNLVVLLSNLRQRCTAKTHISVHDGQEAKEVDCISGTCVDSNNMEETTKSYREMEPKIEESSDSSGLHGLTSERLPEELDVTNKDLTIAIPSQPADMTDRPLASFDSNTVGFRIDNGLKHQTSKESQTPQRDETAAEPFTAYSSQIIVDDQTHFGTLFTPLKWLISKVVSSLPDEIRPGPDFYGLPWEAVGYTAILGLCTVLIFTCRFYNSIKSRLYAGKERKMGQRVAELLDEKCKVLETLSECKHRYEKLESAIQKGGGLSHLSEKENLEVMSQKLEESNSQMSDDIDRLKEELANERSKREQQEKRLEDMRETLRSLENEAKDMKSQMEQAKTTLKIHNMNSEKLLKDLQAAKEENVMLLESKDQLVQEAEGWAERLSELEEEMRMCESSHDGMQEDCTNKDERIKSLTDCLLKMKDWDSELGDGCDAEGSNGRTGNENGNSLDFQQKQKVQKLIYAAKMSADLKSLEEDKDRVMAKLSDEIKAKEDLQGGIEQLQTQKDLLLSESAQFSSETQKLQQKLQIMTDMYRENELKLHRMLTVEERERLEKEEKLNKADKKISLATEELSTYRRRADELEEELEKTNQAYNNQIASHEKKAHDNWLASRSAERDLNDIKRENAQLRQRLTDSQFKFEVLEKDPYAREAPGRPLFRGESP